MCRPTRHCSTQMLRHIDSDLSGSVNSNKGIGFHSGCVNYMKRLSLKKVIIAILLLTTLMVSLPYHKVFSATTEVLSDGVALPALAPSPGLVAYYPFEGDYQDRSGSNNHGNAKGNVGFATGKVGQAASFDGQSWIEVGDSDSLDLTNAFTFGLWIYKEDNGRGGYSVILCKGDTAALDNNSPYALAHTYDGFYPLLRLTKNNTYTDLSFTARTPDFKRWYYLAVTWDGRTATCYLDGAIKDNRIWEGPLPLSTSKLLIGCDQPGYMEYFRGIMDELRIYNRALSREEITSLYGADVPGSSTLTPTTPAPAPAPPPTPTQPVPTPVPPPTSTPLPQPPISPPQSSSPIPSPTPTPVTAPPASGGAKEGIGFMELFLRIIGYLSILILVISFAFMIKNLRRGRRLTIRSLIIPVLMSIVFLVVYSTILDIPGPTAISAALAILGLVLGVLWSRTTQLTVKGSTVYAQRSVWYVVIWGLSIVFTQFMAVTATPELASYGLSTLYFSTGLAVSTNVSLLLRRLEVLPQLKKDGLTKCPR